MARVKTTTMLSSLLLLSLSGNAILAGLHFGLFEDREGGRRSRATRASESDYQIAADPELVGSNSLTRRSRPSELAEPAQFGSATKIESLSTRLEAERKRREALAKKNEELVKKIDDVVASKVQEEKKAIGELVSETASLYGKWMKEYQEAAKNGKQLSQKEQRELGMRYQKEFMPKFMKMAADKKKALTAILKLLEDPETENKNYIAQMMNSLSNYPGEDEDMTEVNERIFTMLDKDETSDELRTQLLMGVQTGSETAQRRSLDLFVDLTRNSDDVSLRTMALYKLASFSISGAREEVSQIITNTSEPAQVRAGAIQAIDFSSWPNGMEVFQTLAADPNQSIRQSVYSRSYQMSNSQELRSSLQNALVNEPATNLLSSVQYGLQIHGDAETMTFLQEVARNEELEPVRRATAQQAFNNIKQRLDQAKAQQEALRGVR